MITTAIEDVFAFCKSAGEPTMLARWELQDIVHTSHVFRRQRNISILVLAVCTFASVVTAAIGAPDSSHPNDEFYAHQWHLPDVGADRAWRHTTGDPDIIIAVLDTGVDADHPELDGRLVPGWNVYDGNDDTTDHFGHGTAVIGTLAAWGNNEEGVASVAWGCSIMPIRVTNPIGTSSSRLVSLGLYWAADHGARVANISLGVTDTHMIQEAVDYFVDYGGGW